MCSVCGVCVCVCGMGELCVVCVWCVCVCGGVCVGEGGALKTIKE